MMDYLSRVMMVAGVLIALFGVISIIFTRLASPLEAMAATGCVFALLGWVFSFFRE